MGLNIVELFGYAADDFSKPALSGRQAFACPFIHDQCTKKLSDSTISGACTVRQMSGPPIVCCPNRLYWNDYQVLLNIAQEAFGPDASLLSRNKGISSSPPSRPVAVFGKRWGKELRLPKRAGRGNFFVDWVLVLLDAKGKPKEFVAVKVQSIDTTGNYRSERLSILKQQPFPGASKAGMNWENVNKRILPQLIYKGHVLRREQMCTKGLFFVCPAPVYKHINDRLGNCLTSFPHDRGTVTFSWYDLGPAVPSGRHPFLVQSRLPNHDDRPAHPRAGPRH